MVTEVIESSPLTATTANEVSSSMPVGGPWSSVYRRTTIGLILMVVCTAFEALAVATVMPDTVDDLGGLSYYGWAFSAYLLTYLIGLVISGDESDRRGPSIPFLIGVSLFIAGLLISGFAPTMIVLIIGRAVQGFGGGLFSSVTYVTLGRVPNQPAHGCWHCSPPPGSSPA
jgi:MFS family permease